MIGFVFANTGKSESQPAAAVSEGIVSEGIVSEGIVWDENTIPLNSVNYRFRDPVTKDLVMTGDIISPIDGKVDVIMEIKQNMPEPREYVLIIFVNNVQHNFYADNTEYRSYQFSLDEMGSLNAKINVDVDKDTDKEILFAFFRQPNFIDADADRVEFPRFSKSLSVRMFLYSAPEERPYMDISTEAQAADYDDRVLELYTADDTEFLGILSKVESGREINAIISNRYDYETVYALGSFLNWEQYNFPDGDIVKYVRVPPKSTVIYKLKIPTVTQNTPYQVYALPYGYMTLSDMDLDYERLDLFTSTRMVITP